MEKVLQLHTAGYCEHCSKPIKSGQSIADIRTPEGVSRVHRSCLGPEKDPPPTDGGTPIALAA